MRRRKPLRFGEILATAFVCAVIAGCAGQSKDQAANAAKWDAAYKNVVAASGENEATDALVARLRVFCNLPNTSVNSIPTLTDRAGPVATDAFGLVPYATADACARSRVVAAFDASEGEPFCRQRLDTGDFVACVINGAFATRLAKKLGVSMTAAERWHPPLEGNYHPDKARTRVMGKAKQSSPEFSPQTLSAARKAYDEFEEVYLAGLPQPSSHAVEALLHQIGRAFLASEKCRSRAISK